MVIETDGIRFVERLTEAEKVKLKALENKLDVVDMMRREYVRKRDKAQANAWDTGSSSSYKTMQRYEAYLAVLKHAENDICNQIAAIKR